jgi:ATP-dependent exoDNAse (exonuclease V) beta subunit
MAARRSERRAVVALPAVAAEALAPARERAALFLKRNPSALAEAALAEADPAAYVQMTQRASGTPNAGLLYGTWWHEFVERLDWRAHAAAWDATFQEALADSPDADLSRREWTLLRGHLTSGSEVGQLLTKPEAVIHAEMPFLWAMSERECLDGIVDLAVFDPTAGSWLILDWKTNRVAPAELPSLQAHYLPQLSAYWKAASAMLAAPVTAGLYSTATGQWLPYTTEALATASTAVVFAP